MQDLKNVSFCAYADGVSIYKTSPETLLLHVYQIPLKFPKHDCVIQWFHFIQ